LAEKELFAEYGPYRIYMSGSGMSHFKHFEIVDTRTGKAAHSLDVEGEVFFFKLLKGRQRSGFAVLGYREWYTGSLVSGFAVLDNGRANWIHTQFNGIELSNGVYSDVDVHVMPGNSSIAVAACSAYMERCVLTTPPSHKNYVVMCTNRALPVRVRSADQSGEWLTYAVYRKYPMWMPDFLVSVGDHLVDVCDDMLLVYNTDRLQYEVRRAELPAVQVMSVSSSAVKSAVFGTDCSLVFVVDLEGELIAAVYEPSEDGSSYELSEEVELPEEARDMLSDRVLTRIAGELVFVEKKQLI